MVLLAIRTASASSLYGMTTSTGPKISSCANVSVALMPKMVGCTK